MIHDVNSLQDRQYRHLVDSKAIGNPAHLGFDELTGHQGVLIFREIVEICNHRVCGGLTLYQRYEYGGIDVNDHRSLRSNKSASRADSPQSTCTGLRAANFAPGIALCTRIPSKGSC